MREHIISFSDLHWELSNLAYVVGDVASKDGNAHRLHQTFDICHEGNIERVNGLLDLSFLEVRNAAGPQCHCTRQRRGYSFRGAEAELAAALAKEYLVCRVLGRWLEVTLPEAAGVWLLRAEECLSGLRCRHVKGRPRRLSPF